MTNGYEGTSHNTMPVVTTVRDSDTVARSHARHIPAKKVQELVALRSTTLQQEIM